MVDLVGGGQRAAHAEDARQNPANETADCDYPTMHPRLEYQGALNGRLDLSFQRV